MPAPHRSFPRFTIIGTALAIACLSGCAASEKSAYERHLATMIQPGPAANDDVVIAFGLDRGEIPARAVAAVKD